MLRCRAGRKWLSRTDILPWTVPSLADSFQVSICKFRAVPGGADRDGYPVRLSWAVWTRRHPFSSKVPREDSEGECLSPEGGTSEVLAHTSSWSSGRVPASGQGNQNARPVSLSIAL